MLFFKIYSANRTLLWSILATIKEYILLEKDSLLIDISVTDKLIKENINKLLKIFLVKEKDTENTLLIKYILSVLT